MKKNKNKIKKFDVLNKLNINTFEKKPQKGGTPAIENKAIIKNFVNTLCEPNTLKDDIVLVLKLTNCIKV